MKEKILHYLFRKEYDEDDAKGCVDWSAEKWLTLFSAILLGIGLVYYLYIRIRYGAVFADGEVSCVMRKYTGLLCPGCGATHALFYFMNFNWIKSIQYNAFIFIMLLTLIPFTVGNFLHQITKGKTPAIRFHLTYMWFYLAVLILNAIIRDVIVVLNHQSIFY